jgi:[ribosomal protein S5]-alanine N-acetyltransferase
LRDIPAGDVKERQVTIFETERLIVRDWTLDDAEDAFAIYGDPEVTRYLGGDPYRETVEEVRELLARSIARNAERAPLGSWAVVEKASGSVVGGAILLAAPINGSEEIELGYHFAKAAWGKGYATEVSFGLLDYGFNRLGLERIVGVYFEENPASGNVLRKIGMRDEGAADYNGTTLRYFVADRPD